MSIPALNEIECTGIALYEIYKLRQGLLTQLLKRMTFDSINALLHF